MMFHSFPHLSGLGLIKKQAEVYSACILSKELYPDLKL
jgi:hypothetical protein